MAADEAFKEEKALLKEETVMRQECNDCQEQTDHWCSECPNQPPICHSCFESTHQVPKKKNHKLRPLSEKVSFSCRLHNQPLALYCHEHRTLICLVCSHDPLHKNHATVPLASAAAELRDNVEDAAHHLDQLAREASKQLQHHSREVARLTDRVNRLMVSRRRCLDAEGESNPLLFLLQWEAAATLAGQLFVSHTFHESKIVDRAMSFTLSHYLPEDCRRAQLLWRGSRDGFEASTFRTLCSGRGPTVTIVETTRGSVFGGFASREWGVPNGYAADPHAFLFTLKRQGQDLVTKLPQKPSCSHSVLDSTGSGPTFGGGHDLYIADRGNANSNSYTLSNHSFESSLSSLDGQRNFILQEIEVFSLQFSV